MKNKVHPQQKNRESKGCRANMTNSLFLMSSNGFAESFNENETAYRWYQCWEAEHP